jgi:tetratricopeptide (TPR) repeat protein
MTPHYGFPSYFPFMLLMTFLVLATGQLSFAQETVSDAWQNNIPTTAAALKEEAKMLIEQRDYQGAIAKLEESLVIKQDYYLAVYNLAIAYALRGTNLQAPSQHDRNRAWHEINRARTIAEGQGIWDAALYSTIGWLASMEAIFTRPEEFSRRTVWYDRAQQYWEYALTIDSASADTLNNLGALYELRGDSKRAGEYYAKAEALQGAYATASYSADRRYVIKNPTNTSIAIFVHGFRGEYVATWGKLPELLQKDPDLDSYDFLFWGYPSKLFSAGEKIGTMGQHLKIEIDLLPKTYNRIILIGYSMGGLVIRSYIVQALLDGKGNDLKSIVDVVLFGTPNEGLSSVEAIPRIVNDQIADLGLASELIVTLRKYWVQRVTSAQRNDEYNRQIPTIAVAGYNDNFVPKDSVNSFFRDTAITDGDHTSMVKPENTEHLTYRIIKTRLLGGRAPCESQITAPLDGENVGSQGKVHGKARIPTGSSLWVLAHLKSPQEDKWWPQGGGAASIDKDGTWVVEVSYGMARGDIGKDFEIALAVVSEHVNTSLRQWVQRADQTDQYLPIAFPNVIDGCPLPKITVKKKSFE